MNGSAPAGASVIATEEDARALAARILAPRTRPLVVVSTDPATGDYVIDPARLADGVGRLAELVLVPTGDLSRIVAAALPERTQVYGGAGRSYPADFGRDPDWRRSPLRFPDAAAVDRLVGDVLGHANAAGLFAHAPQTAAQVSGVVKGFVPDGSRALVEVAGEGFATVSRELTYPPFPLDWTLAKGQRVTGLYDQEAKRLLVEQPTPDVEALRAAFPHGSVTLAYVAAVTADRAQLLLHPKAKPVTVRLADVSPNPLDTIDMLLAEGDVVAARVVHLSEGIHLRLLDVDDDEQVLPAMPVTTNGPAWLVEGRALVAVDDAGAEPVAPAAQPPVTAQASARAADAAVPESPGAAAGEPAAPGGVEGPPMPGPGLRAVVPHPPAHLVGRSAPPQPETRPAAGPALQSVQLELAATQARIRVLEAELVRVGEQRLRERTADAEARTREVLADNAGLERRIAALEAERRAGTRALREARRARGSAVAERDARRARWAHDEEWMRHELYLAWVERVSAAERARWPLREVIIGARFAASLADLDDGQFDKAMKAAVDVATGLVRELPAREAHPLRDGEGAHARDVVRADGAKCWRIYIEHRTPAARRLHYWVLPAGGVELSRVVTHDDTEP